MPKIKKDELKWVEDRNAETVMKNLSLAYEIHTLEISEIDWDTTDNNRGRLGRNFERDVAEDFAHDMKKGEEFPRPVAKLNPKGTYTILAGVHRSRGAQIAGLLTLEVYVVVNLTEKEEFLLCVQTNRKEGRRLDRKTAYMHGILLIREYDESVQDAANEIGVSLSSLSKRKREDDLRLLLQSLGFRNEIDQVHWANLSSLPRFDEVLLTAANLISSYRLTGEESKVLTNKLNELRSEAQQLALLDGEKNKYKQDRDRVRGKKGKRSAKSLFIGAINKLHTRINQYPTKERMELLRESDEFRESKRLWEIVRRKVNNVFK